MWAPGFTLSLDPSWFDHEFRAQRFIRLDMRGALWAVPVRPVRYSRHLLAVVGTQNSNKPICASKAYNILDKEAPMAIETHYLFTASMDVDPDKEDLFNEVYDTEHIPNLKEVPGLISVTR